MHRLLALVSWVALTVGVPALASAQQGGSKLRIGAGMVLDFGGEVDSDWPRGTLGFRDDDLKLTPGLRGHLDYDLHKYVSLGGFMRFSFWEGDDIWESRSFLFDIGPRLTGHYDWRDFRFYVALMIGLSISKLNNDFGGFDNPGLGAAVAIGPGFEWWFSRRAALFIEMFGWSGHFVSHDLDNISGDVDFAINQVLWQLGVTFAP